MSQTQDYGCLVFGSLANLFDFVFLVPTFGPHFREQQQTHDTQTRLLMSLAIASFGVVCGHAASTAPFAAFCFDNVAVFFGVWPSRRSACPLWVPAWLNETLRYNFKKQTTTSIETKRKKKIPARE